MRIREIVTRALATTWQTWPVVLVLWGVGLVLALVAVQPAAAMLSSELDHSLLARGIEGFVSSRTAVDIGSVLLEALPAARASLVATSLVFAALHVILLGGVMGRLAAAARGGDGYTMFAGFLADAGRYGWRSVRLAAWGLLLTLAVVAIVGGGGVLLLSRLDTGLYASPMLWLRAVHHAVVLAALVTTRAMVDAARADMFLEERRTMRRAMREGIVQVLRYPRTSLVAYALTGAVLLSGAAGVMAFRFWFPETGWGGILIAGVIGQAAMLLRAGSMVATTAAALWARGEPVPRDHWAAARVRLSSWGDR